MTKEIWVEKKKKELTDEEAKSGEKKYKLETVVCGQIKNTEVLLSVNDLGKIYKEDIESVIQGLEKLDLQKATARQIQTIGRAASALDVRLETASQVKDSCDGFFNP